MVSNLFLQLIHIELLLSYSVKEILTLVKRDPRFNVKLLNDLYFGDSVIDEETHRFIANNVVSWLYERGENPDEFIERIVKRCSDFEAIPSRCVLRTYLPYISSFYSCKDVRELCLEIIPKRYQFLKQAAVLRNEVVAENREADAASLGSCTATCKATCQRRSAPFAGEPSCSGKAEYPHFPEAGFRFGVSYRRG